MLPEALIVPTRGGSSSSLAQECELLQKHPVHGYSPATEFTIDPMLVENNTDPRDIPVMVALPESQ